MSMDSTPTLDSILNEITAEMAPVPVYGTNVPLDVQRAVESGYFSPYISVSFGGPVEHRPSRGICGARKSSMQYWTVATVVTPDDDTGLLLKGKLLDRLTGFTPTDGTELVPSGGQAQSAANENKVPLIYQHRVMFTFYQNMSS